MSERITPPTLYFAVFAALIGLTLLTVGVSFLELGSWHTAVGVGIGVVKAVLVALFFMHLWHSTRVTWLVVVAGLFWLSILMLMTLVDYLTRHWLAY
jgi:cytochrome c oxidase subunit IV